MSIFVARSKGRRVFFRALVTGVIALFLCTTFLFLIALISGTKRAVLSTETASNSYYYYYTPASNKKVALTFDDGPNKDTTANMEVLTRHGVPATFFFIGENVIAHPDIARGVAEHGFAIGNHTFTHSFNIENSKKRLALELHATEVVIESATQRTPTYFRPPYLLGIGVDPAPNPYIPSDTANGWSLELGYLPVGIDIDSRDWLATSSVEIVANFKEALKGGGHIALFHDVPGTAEALEEIIPWLNREGYQIVPLRTLLIPPAFPPLTRNLHRGDSDATTSGEVTQLQWFLYKQRVFDMYDISGVFDQNTVDALTLFQVEEGLLDPAAPDPTRVAVADEATRERIAALGSVAALSGAPEPILLTRISHFLERHYILLLSYLGASITVLAQIAVVIIILRVAVLIGLLTAPRLYQKRRKRYPAFDGKVTILIPAYNEEENIRSTIESTLRSFYQKREVIVINDGSTDSTKQVVEETIAAHPKSTISLLSVENGGKARALTLGAQKARGDVLVILDADAVLDAEAVSLMVRHFSDPKIGAVAGKVYTTSQRTLLDRFQALEYAVGQNIDKRAMGNVNAVGVVPGPAGAWRRSLVLEAGGFPQDTLVEDQDMTLTVLRMGYQIRYEPRALAYTETPHTIRNFLAQRFRWVYGTVQCFWKHKGVFIEQPRSVMSLIIMPNTLLFSILLPLTYPLVDTVLIGSLFFGVWQNVLLPVLVFTGVDMLYAMWGLSGEKRQKGLLWFVPLQRLYYRQLLYYTVIRSLVHAIEGRGSRWNKFAKMGETQRFYFDTVKSGRAPVAASSGKRASPQKTPTVRATPN